VNHRTASFFLLERSTSRQQQRQDHPPQGTDLEKESHFQTQSLQFTLSEVDTAATRENSSAILPFLIQYKRTRVSW
jgi:hypothetical protein